MTRERNLALLTLRRGNDSRGAHSPENSATFLLRPPLPEMPRLASPEFESTHLRNTTVPHIHHYAHQSTQ
ncbi:hypothetical protein E2C01_098995 [Portunus trituberculatus]|uniref:Uncharacterized protein n=1 Tax=Portunus trituberculatus TaxID=210409 RepID=A0A5B7KE96_PORTR|nr:hypothetical protein [Portunus trituberculatus]